MAQYDSDRPTPGSEHAGPSSSYPSRIDQQEPRHSRTGLWVTLVIVVIAAVALVYYISGKGNAGGEAAGGKAGGHGRGQEGPAMITTAASYTGDINVYVQALGTVTPVSTITLYPQVTGVVTGVHYHEGQLVQKGAPLIDIDPRPYEATLHQAMGTLAHDQAVLDQAKMDLARYQAAFAKNAIARQTVDDQEKLVAQYEGTITTDQATVAYDKVQLSYCHISAPISGRVGLRLVDPGNTVFSGSGSTLVVITQLDPITVVFNVSEDDLPSIQQQLAGRNKTLPVDVFDRSDTDLLESGKLSSLDNQIDTTTGTLKFRATLPNKGDKLFPNQFVNARLLVNTLKDVVLVPTPAIQHNGTAAFVYILQPDNTVHVQPVSIEASNDSVAAVTNLAANTTVAASGFDRLDNGSKVQVKPSKDKGAEGSSGSTGMGPSSVGRGAK